MQVHESNAFQEFPKDDKPSVKKKNISEKDIFTIMQDMKISKKEAKKFGLSRTYDLTKSEDLIAFEQEMGEKYKLPEYTQEKKLDIKELKRTRKSIALEHEITHNERIVSKQPDTQSQEIVKTMNSILTKFPNIGQQAEEIVTFLIGPFKKEDGTIDTEGIEQFLLNIAGEGSNLNLNEIKAALDKMPQKTDTD